MAGDLKSRSRESRGHRADKTTPRRSVRGLYQGIRVVAPDCTTLRPSEGRGNAEGQCMPTNVGDRVRTSSPDRCRLYAEFCGVARTFADKASGRPTSKTGPVHQKAPWPSSGILIGTDSR